MNSPRASDFNSRGELQCRFASPLWPGQRPAAIGKSAEAALTRRNVLLLMFLTSVAFGLATQLSLWREQSGRQTVSDGVLEALLGDSRRLFANHFFTKADVYLHQGVYPSLFDQVEKERKLHLANEAGEGTPAVAMAASEQHDGHDPATCEHEHHDHSGHAHPGDSEHEEEHDVVSGFLTPPRDWIESFGRHFFPTRHVHLETSAGQREILPWLRLAAELNPNEVEIYTVGAYWMRTRMQKIQEAERFLREGWRRNPSSFEILFELGRLHEENNRDRSRARNMYLLALRHWQQSESAKPDSDMVTYRQIIGRLAKLEEAEGQVAQAIYYLEILRKVSPNADQLDRQIATLKERAHPAPEPGVL